MSNFDLTYGKPCGGLFSYCGGKVRLINAIATMAYYYGVYCLIDVCAGSGVVSLNIETCNKVINDIDTDLSVIYRALSTPETESRLLLAMGNADYTVKLYKEAQEYWAANSDKKLNDFSDSNIVEAAYYSWMLRKMSRTGSHIDNACKLNEERMTKLNNFKDKLYNYYGRLLGAEVKNMNMLELLKDYADNPHTIPQNSVFYIDPPYLPSKLRNGDNKKIYNHTFGVEQHKELLELVSRLPPERCRVLISGYDYADDVYRDAISQMKDWQQLYVCDIPVMFGNGNKLKDGKRPIEKEYFYTNIR
ncbi:MAG: DNA adenine methylase [Acutalibacteraceae bacterium]